MHGILPSFSNEKPTQVLTTLRLGFNQQRRVSRVVGSIGFVPNNNTTKQQENSSKNRQRIIINNSSYKQTKKIHTAPTPAVRIKNPSPKARSFPHSEVSQTTRGFPNKMKNKRKAKMRVP
jgi:hypothetical protein